MTGYELTTRLRKIRRKHPLTATEQALYHELVAICNDVEWEDVFNASNTELCNVLNIDQKTLIRARNSLIQSGLLYYKSGKSKRTHSLYSFTKKFSTTGTMPIDKGTTNGATTGNMPIDMGMDVGMDKGTIIPSTTGIIPDIIHKENKGKEEEPKSYKKLSEKEFMNECATFLSTYSKEMIRAFFNYWSEKDEKGRMKFQLNPTWDLKKRLETWHSKSKNFEPVKKETPVIQSSNPPLKMIS